MSQNKSVEEVVEVLLGKWKPFEVEGDHSQFSEGIFVPDVEVLKEDITRTIQQERQTSQEREREIVGKLFEALDYQNTERELNAKEEDRMGIKLALQQFKLKFLTEYNIPLTNPNKD